MKEIINLNPKELIKLSYSSISDFDRNGPTSLVKREKVKSDSVKHGSLVDVLLYDQMTGSDFFNQTFVIDNDIVTPTATLKSLADIIISFYTEIPSKEEILEIIKTNKFWKRVKDEKTILSYFDNDSFYKYLNHKMFETEKEVVSIKDKITASDSVNVLLSHPFTKNLFYNDYDNYYQYPFEYEYRGVLLRGVIDKITINHNDKICHMEDIKTGTGDFMKSFIDYRYYFQGYVYNNAFKYICKELKLKGYKLAPFKYIYIKKNSTTPLIWTLSNKWLNAAKKGFVTKSGYQYRGIDLLIEEIKYHIKNKQFDVSKEIYENEGVINIYDNFIEVNEKAL